MYHLRVGSGIDWKRLTGTNILACVKSFLVFYIKIYSFNDKLVSFVPDMFIQATLIFVNKASSLPIECVHKRCNLLSNIRLDSIELERDKLVAQFAPTFVIKKRDKHTSLF